MLYKNHSVGLFLNNLSYFYDGQNKRVKGIKFSKRVQQIKFSQNNFHQKNSYRYNYNKMSLMASYDARIRFLYQIRHISDTSIRLFLK